jgi:hypothetical protein
MTPGRRSNPGILLFYYLDSNESHIFYNIKAIAVPPIAARPPIRTKPDFEAPPINSPPSVLFPIVPSVPTSVGEIDAVESGPLSPPMLAMMPPNPHYEVVPSLEEKEGTGFHYHFVNLRKYCGS